jgi:chemotaxis protein CheD
MPAPNLRIDRFLQPGEVALGRASHHLSTLLGSCVSITLWHPGRRVGAMSHFLLAQRDRSGPQGAAALDARYGDEALCLMVDAMHRAGAPPGQCEAKLFGGGNMFPGAAGPAPVGRQNGEAARRLLRAHGIAVVAESLFGVGHRQLRFDVGSGEVWVRQVGIVAPRAAA